MQRLILLIDDDALLRRSLGFNLEQAGFRVKTAASGEDGIALARQIQPDLVLLDINLPGLDGLDTLRILRDEMRLPVVFVTARRRELDEILGLELGADDYITKPFDFDVLLARVKAVLRRRAAPEEARPSEVVQVGNLTIDPAGHTVTMEGKPIDLSPREFDLLYTLSRAPGQVISTNDLLARVWGAEYAGEPQVLYVHIRWLREKLEIDPQHPRLIITARGVGYKLVP